MFKGNIKCVVEVKLYAIGNKIGREKIQKLDSAMRHTKSNFAYFVTTSEFTSNAIEYAHECGIKLIDGNLLARMVQETAEFLSSNKN